MEHVAVAGLWKRWVYQIYIALLLKYVSCPVWSIHQGDKRFSDESWGRQCAFTSLTELLIWPTWTSSSVESALSGLYDFCFSHAVSKLHLNHILPSVHIFARPENLPVYTPGLVWLRSRSVRACKCSYRDYFMESARVRFLFTSCEVSYKTSERVICLLYEYWVMELALTRLFVAQL